MVSASAVRRDDIGGARDLWLQIVQIVPYYITLVRLVVNVNKTDPTVMDDYIHVLQAYLTHLPIPTSHSSHLPTFLSHILSTLSCPSIETIISSLDTLATLASLLSNPSTTDLIQPVFAQYGKAIIVLLLDGVVQAFPEDVVEQVQVVVGATVTCVQALGRGKEVEGWAGEAMAGLPGNVLPGGEKEVFLRELHE